MAFSGPTIGRWLLPLLVLAALVGAPDSAGPALGAAGTRSTAHVVDYGPTGQVGSTITQVKVRFSRPMGFFEEGQEGVSSSLLHITPAVAGHLYWMAPDLLVFESNSPFPAATTFEVGLAPSFTSFDGAKIDSPPSWRFETARPVCTTGALPWERRGQLAVGDAIALGCNQVPVLASLPAAISVSANGREWPVRFAPAPKDEKAILVQPARPWPLGSKLVVSIRPGLHSNAGPLPSDTKDQTTYSVAPEPTAVDVSCRNQLVLRFATPVSDKAWKSVRIEPAPRTELDRPYWKVERSRPDGPAMWTAELPLATPGTLYTITVPAGIEDIYGQKTRSDWRREILCPLPKEEATLMLGRPMETMIGVFESAKPRTTILQTKVIKAARIEYVPLDPASFTPDAIRALVAWATPARYVDEEDVGDVLDEDSTKASSLFVPKFTLSKQIKIVAEPEQPLDRTILDLSDLPKGKLVAARVAAQVDAAEPEGRALLQVTDVGLLGWLTRGRGAIQAVHLSTGQPWSAISLRTGKGAGPWGAAGTTNARGVAIVDSPFSSIDAIHAVAAVDHDGLLYLTKSAAASGYTDWQQEDSDGEFEVPPSEALLGDLVLDRSLFAAGELIHFSGYAALGEPNGRVLALPAGTRMKITLGEGQTGSNPIEVAPDAAGKFWGQIRLPKDASLGTKLLHASLLRQGKTEDEASQELTAELRVASFRVPDVEVKARISQKDTGPGETPRLVVETKHFSGSTAELRSASVVKRCRPHNRHYPDGRWVIGPRGESNALPTSDRLQVDERDLAKGTFSLDVPSLPLDPLRLTQCTVDVTVRDESLRSESARVEYSIHPARFGLALLAEQVKDSKRLRVAIKALDANARRVAVPDVVVQVRSEDSLLLVKSARLAVGISGESTVIELPEVEEGRYLVSVEAYDGLRPVRSETELRVFEPWPKTRRTPVKAARMAAEDEGQPEITLPDLGRVGEFITVSIRAPKRARSGLLGFLRGEVQDAIPLRFEAGLAKVRVKVRDAWFPEVSVHAAVVLPGGHGHDQKVPPKAELLQAEHQLPISPDHRALKVAVKGPATSGPGSEVTYEVSLRDSAGQPVPSARISAWAVDEGLLALRDYHVPGLVDAFAFRPEDQIVEVDSFENLLAPFLEAELDELGSGFGTIGRGGGGLGGRRARSPELDSSVRVRSRFETTPFFLGDAAVDGRGEAKFKFRLPDNLTRFRITVVAAAPLQKEGPYLRFGNRETTIQVSQPLSLRPLVPRFLRPGDRSEASVVVLNQGASAGQVEVTLTQETEPGTKDAVAIDGVSKRSLTLAAGQERRVSFGIQAHAEGRAQLLFTAKLGQGARFQDAVRLPLEVQAEPAIVDHIAMSGTLPGGAVEEIPVRLPEDAALASAGGEWHLRLARGFEIDREGALRYLASYRYACAEQTASTLLPLLLFPNDPVLATQGKAESRVKARLARLERLKVSSHRPEDEGGIDFWPGSRRPDLFATAWALLVLSHASEDIGAGPQIESLGKATASLLAAPVTDRHWSSAVRALGYLALAQARFKVKDVPTPAPAYEPITTGFAALALVESAGKDLTLRSKAVETARRWLSEAILRLREHGRLLHAQASATAHDMPAHDAEVAELALAWALAHVWPDHPARPKLARALAEHRRASQFMNTFENALFLLVAADAAEQARGKGTVEGMADDVQLLPSVAWPDAGKLLDRVWPLSALPKSFFTQDRGGRFILRGQGDGELFYSLDASFPAENPDAALERGLSIETHLRDPRQSRGDVVEVGAGEILALDIFLGARSAQEFLAIDVPLPAGLEAINPDIPVESLAVGPEVVVHHDFAFEHQELHAERVLVFPRFLRTGVAKHTVFLRALLAGSYQMPSPRAEVMYNPEIHGRGKATRIMILPAAQ